MEPTELRELELLARYLAWRLTTPLEPQNRERIERALDRYRALPRARLRLAQLWPKRLHGDAASEKRTRSEAANPDCLQAFCGSVWLVVI